MKFTVLSENAQIDSKGKLTNAYDVVNEHGQHWWLVPSLRHQLNYGPLKLKRRDSVVVADIIQFQWPIIRADFIGKVSTAPNN